MENHPKKVLDQARDALRLKHYSLRTEQSYLARIRRFILFHYKRHPLEMRVPEIEAFLTHLAVHEHVAARLLAFQVHYDTNRPPDHSSGEFTRTNLGRLMNRLATATPSRPACAA